MRAMTSADVVESTSVSCALAEGDLVKTDAKGRLRVSREQRKAVLAKFEQSGMSAAKFAIVAGIKYSTFAGWVQRYRRANPKAALRRLRLLEAVVNPSHAPERTSEHVLMVHLPEQRIGTASKHSTIAVDTCQAPFTVASASRDLNSYQSSRFQLAATFPLTP